MLKKITAVFLAMILFLLPAVGVTAEGETATPEGVSTALDLGIRAKAAILIEATTGKVLYAMNEHAQLPPASVTKIMTMALVLEKVSQGAMTFDDIVTASENAKHMGGSEIFLDTGEQMSVYDLMMAVAVASANDAAVALGEHLGGGSETVFADMMNAKAKELGMNDSHFVNPNGLHEEGHVTSAYDIALMSKYLLSFPDAQTFTATNIYPIREGAKEYKMRNSNELVRTYEGCIGLKTGFTNEAGYCLSAAATRGGETFIGVVMGAETSAIRNEDMAKMLDYAFDHYQTYDVPVDPVNIAPIPVVLGLQDTAEVSIPDLTVPRQVIDKGSTPAVETVITVDEKVEAPATAGQKVGEVTVIMNGETLHTFDLTLGKDIQKRTFWKAFVILLKRIISM